MSAHAAAAELLQILQLEQIEQNLFLGQNESAGRRRLFGGQVLAQAAMAASCTVQDLQLHSLHSYFLHPGSPDRPVLFEVERIRDGRSFTTRRVVAIQNGQAIFNMDVSFQIEEPGLEHADSMPNVPLPEELQDDVELANQVADRPLSPMARVERPFETRSVFQLDRQGTYEDRSWSPVWMKFRPTEVTHDAVPDAVLNRCLLAYASDMGMVSTASLPHQSEVERTEIMMASLDHALWIHREVPIDDWLLFHKRTSAAQGARGLVHANFFSRHGTLIASVTQEGLLRLPQTAT